MKKVFTTLAIALMSVVAANAQLVVGGTINFTTTGGIVTKTNNATKKGIIDKTDLDFSMGIAPRVGYIINEKWEVGGALVLSYVDNLQYACVAKIPGTGEKADFNAYKDQRNMNFAWAIAPYARFRCFETKGFGIWIEGIAELGSVGGIKTKFYAYCDDNYTGFRTKDQADELNKNNPLTPKVSNFTGGLYFAPVLTYEFNEHLVLETSLNFLGFGLSGSTTKTKNSDGDWVKTSSCDFSLNVTSGNIATLGMIQIGAVYKF